MRLAQCVRTRSLVRVITYLALLSFFAGCSDSHRYDPPAEETGTSNAGGNTNTTTTTTTTTLALTGGGIKGPLANAVVTVYNINPSEAGMKGSVAGSGSTNAQAQIQNLSLTFPLAPPYILEVTSDANTTDITTGMAPVITTMRTVVTQALLDSGEQIYATPLTTMAVDIAIADPVSLDGVSFEAALLTAASQVKSTMGFGMDESVDIFDTPPLIDSTTDTAEEQASVAAYRSAVEALTAIVFEMQQVTTGDADTVTPDDILSGLSDDLSADGVIDGTGTAALEYDVTALDILEQDPATLTIPNTDTTVGDVEALLVVETTDTGATTDTTALATTEVVLAPAETNPDIDGDGVDNADDAFPEDDSEQYDNDNDGIGDATDGDDDNDGVLDGSDKFPFNPAEWIDTDNDGTGNNADDDDDNDGVLDVNDDFPLDGTKSNATDQDNDGWPAGQDSDDNNVDIPLTTYVDTDGDGQADDGGLSPDDDDDNDGVLDGSDDFPLNALETKDTDADGVGDNSDSDIDGDGVANDKDAFPYNDTESLDTDGDGVANGADDDDDGDGILDVDEAGGLDPLKPDTDGDGYLDGTDADPLDPNVTLDTDGDGVDNEVDNCPGAANGVSEDNQADNDIDGFGDACDGDDDNDTVIDSADNCPINSNIEQTNTDRDAMGDVCDTDDDEDGILDGADNCPLESNPLQEDNNTAGGPGDACDTDTDGDGTADGIDNCPAIANTNQADNDADTIGDVCDSDDDNDGVLDSSDNCPVASNSSQGDADSDNVGDACDNDDDNDTVVDSSDNCPLVSNVDQTNTDGAADGGDACDTDDDNDNLSDTQEALSGTNPLLADTDSDAVNDDTDNCPLVSGAQTDTDSDGDGDVCDSDDDNDGLSDADEATLGTDPLLADSDTDSVGDPLDNCPVTSNSTQQDSDADGAGDACDTDNDNDGVLDSTPDNCPLISNADQTDTDSDGAGDVCDTDDDDDGDLDGADNCPLISNANQTDTDGDGAGDACDIDDDNDTVADSSDNCPLVSNVDQTNTDGLADGGDACDTDDDEDTVLDVVDNCPVTANTLQTDDNNNNIGDACEVDTDGDTVIDGLDNCPAVANADQADNDSDNTGDACDADDDNDGDLDGADNCPLISNADQLDTDSDTLGDACDTDDDNDGDLDGADNCPLTSNADQLDTDSDTLGDACDTDDDGDGDLDGADNCPVISNADQLDTDSDAAGDACDTDDDNDGDLDGADNCPLTSNADQLDTDIDTLGDACDTDDDGDGDLDGADNCPVISNADQLDTDSDAVGDACDTDDDNDGDLDGADNCPLISNANQTDTDSDGAGNACDTDDDNDGVLDVFPDNCPLIANPGQEDNNGIDDGDGIGDACEAAIPDMSGIYLQDYSATSGSEWDVESSSCLSVVGDSGSEFWQFEQVGTALTVNNMNDDWLYTGTIQPDGTFTFSGVDATANVSDNFTGTFNEGAGTFSGTWTGDTNAGGTVCTAIFSVNATLPIAVSEQPIGASGIVWLEADSYWNGSFDEFEFEYGVISDALETQFSWDETNTVWVNSTADAVGGEGYLVADGSVDVVDDILQIDGYAAAPETAIVKLTKVGALVDHEASYVDLEEYNIEGKAMLDILDGSFADGLAGDPVFATGAQAYLATITNTAETYSFWCDASWDDYFDRSGLVCNGIVPVGQVEYPSAGSGNWDPVPATTLAELITSSASFNPATGNGVGLWVGNGNDGSNDYQVNAYLISDDGAVAGENPTVRFYKNFWNDGSYVDTGITTIYSVVDRGGVELVEFVTPQSVIDLSNVDNDDGDSKRFFFVDTVTETSNIVRGGSVFAAGTVEQELMFNTAALDQFKVAFSYTAPPEPDNDGDGTPDSSDNCPSDYNPDQADADSDGDGNVCDFDSDSDGDSWFDNADNCPSVSNDQTDTDGDGLGDACDLGVADTDFDGVLDDEDAFVDNASEQYDTDGDGVGDNSDACPYVTGSVCADLGVSMSGVYNLAWTDSGSSQQLNDAEDACVALDRSSGNVVARVNQIGNQVIIFIDDYRYIGTIDAAGAFTAVGDSSGSLSGTYSAGSPSTITAGSSSNLESNFDNSVTCNEGLNFTGVAAVDVNEQTALTGTVGGGFSWFDEDSYWDGSQEVIEYEYGTLKGSPSLEVINAWNDVTQAWEDVSSEAIGTNYYVPSTGTISSAVADDLFVVSGYGSGGETAIVQPTSSGVLSSSEIIHMDLQEFDVVGLAIMDFMDEGFGNGLLSTDVFTAGAKVYAATLTNTASAYAFWCDDDWNQYITTPVCANLVAIGWEDADGNGQSEAIPATSFDEIILTQADLPADQTAMSGEVLSLGQWSGRGWDSNGQYSVNVFFQTDSGLKGGNNPTVKFYKRYDGNGSGYLIATDAFAEATVGAHQLIEWTIPNSVAELVDVDEEERNPFILLESELDGGPMLRRGKKIIAASTEKELVFNDVATADVVAAFSYGALAPAGFVEASGNGVDFAADSIITYGSSFGVVGSGIYREWEDGTHEYRDYYTLDSAGSGGRWVNQKWLLSSGNLDGSSDEAMTWLVNADGNLEITITNGGSVHQIALNRFNDTLRPDLLVLVDGAYSGALDGATVWSGSPKRLMTQAQYESELTGRVGLVGFDSVAGNYHYSHDPLEQLNLMNNGTFEEFYNDGGTAVSDGTGIWTVDVVNDFFTLDRGDGEQDLVALESIVVDSLDIDGDLNTTENIYTFTGWWQADGTTGLGSMFRDQLLLLP